MIGYGRHFIDDADIQAVVEVLRSGPLTQGPKIEEFEKAVAQYVGAKYAVAVSSGTAALHLAVLAAGITKGDQVVTSANTFAASANCVLYAGGTPSFADINPDSLNIDPESLLQVCQKLNKVKAIIPVHFAGAPCEMKKIKEIAGQFGALVIEDAAHALGSEYIEGGRVGNCAFSAMTIFSFHPVKAIASGEGGMITTNDPSLYKKLLVLRTHGISKNPSDFVHPEDAFTDGIANPWYYEMQNLGFNYRLTDIQSALGISQLKKLEMFVSSRRKSVEKYDTQFSSFPHVVIPQEKYRKESSHHIYVLRLNFEKIGLTRNQFIRHLQNSGIGSQVHYMPVYFHPYYQRQGFKKGICPEAEKYYREALTIPLFVGLTDQDQTCVIRSIKSLISEKEIVV